MTNLLSETSKTTASWRNTSICVCKFIVTVILFVMSLPVLLLAATLVKLTSRGPAFYSQTRVGKHGKPFTFYKIRTMIHECENGIGATWSMLDDPRVTKIGVFLRSTHIDELPQLWHVLRGEMGLVGPRPERPEFVAELEKVFPNYHERYFVRPGITGLAQLHLPPDTSLESVRLKIHYDLYYIQRTSLWMDLRILICTVLSALYVPSNFSFELLGLPTRKEIERTFDARSQTSPAAFGGMSSDRAKSESLGQQGSSPDDPLGTIPSSSSKLPLEPVTLSDLFSERDKAFDDSTPNTIVEN